MEYNINTTMELMDFLNDTRIDMKDKDMIETLTLDDFNIALDVLETHDFDTTHPCELVDWLYDERDKVTGKEKSSKGFTFLDYGITLDVIERFL
jgi:hypothetical protein